jgi:hypothetical protein
VLAVASSEKVMVPWDVPSVMATCTVDPALRAARAAASTADGACPGVKGVAAGAAAGDVLVPAAGGLDGAVLAGGLVAGAVPDGAVPAGVVVVLAPVHPASSPSPARAASVQAR